MTEPNPRQWNQRVDRVVVAACAIGIVALAFVVLLPLWATLVFAVWTAVLLDPLAGRIARVAKGRRKVGAVAVTAVVASLFVPLGILLTSLAITVMTFVREIMASPRAREAVEGLVSADPANGGADLDVGRWIELAETHGAAAWQAGQSVAGAGAWAIVVLFVYFVSLYEFLADGRSMWAWVEEHVPLASETTTRLAAAFVETGRGLIVGAGLTSALQGLISVVMYAALGVPRALVLGALTFFASFIPAVGTGAVWIPVALGLALKGDYGRAAVLAAVGAIGIGTIDNITRPMLQRWGGHLDLPVFLLLLAAFGGLAVFGPAGLLLGPLALRMAREVLVIAREHRAKSEPGR